MARLALNDLNPEAGTHPIPSDPAVLGAALLAAEDALRLMPYFALRYGERGRRFTRSDSAWLATLAELDQETTDKRVSWLAGVLAARGMPSWTLQNHLELLHHALCAAVPVRSPSYRVLLTAARHLAERRQALIPDAVVTSLAVALEPALDPAPGKRLPETAWLLASAVADQQAGLTMAVESLVPWLSDRSRFAGGFIDGVEATLLQVRQLMGGAH
jgi:hypothetical protein